jgi:hypothetical protein
MEQKNFFRSIPHVGNSLLQKILLVLLEQTCYDPLMHRELPCGTKGKTTLQLVLASRSTTHATYTISRALR